MTNPVLMLARNCKHMTLDAIASVLAQDVPVELLLIDQDSTDGLREAVRCQFPEVSVVSLRPQIGVSKAWNHGLRYFLDNRQEEHVWVLNNDVVCRPDNLRELIADGGQFVTAVGVNSRQEIEGEFIRAVRPHPDFSNYLIRKQCWDRVGEFDATMVHYASDADYHLRMHKAGIEAYTIGMPFYHVASGTLKHVHPDDRKAIQEQAELDRQAFVKKWGCAVGSPEYYQRFTAVAGLQSAAQPLPKSSEEPEESRPSQ